MHYYFLVVYAIYSIPNPRFNILFSLLDRTPHVNHSLADLIFPFPIFFLFQANVQFFFNFEIIYALPSALGILFLK